MGCHLWGRTESDTTEVTSQYIVGGTVNWYSHGGKQYGSFSKNLKPELYDPVVPLLCVFLKKKKENTDLKICILMLIALFIIAKIWKQPKNPTDEWIKKEWCIYIHNEILPTIKKNENLPFVAI